MCYILESISLEVFLSVGHWSSKHSWCVCASLGHLEDSSRANQTKTKMLTLCRQLATCKPCGLQPAILKDAGLEFYLILQCFLNAHYLRCANVSDFCKGNNRAVVEAGRRDQVFHQCVAICFSRGYLMLSSERWALNRNFACECLVLSAHFSRVSLLQSNQ